MTLIYRLAYSLLYAFCFSTSFFLLNYLIQNSKETNEKVLTPVFFGINLIVLSSITFFLLLFLRFNLDSYLETGFFSNTINKRQLLVLFIEILEVEFFKQFYFIFLNKSDLKKKSIIKRNSYNKITTHLPEKELVIKEAGKGGELKLNSRQVLYIKGEGHYIKIFYYSERYNKIKFDLIRSSMKNIEKNTEDLYSIVRIHKSYFVNLEHVKYIRTNTRKGLASLGEQNIKIPLTNTYMDVLKHNIQVYYGDAIKIYD